MKEGAGRFTLIVLLCYCYVALPHGAVVLYNCYKGRVEIKKGLSVGGRVICSLFGLIVKV